MNHFAILAHGKGFDLDAFFQAPFLKVSHSWRRDDQKRHGMATSGVRIELGNGEKLSIEDQERIATDFLVSNREALLGLGRIPGADYFFLGLQFPIDLKPWGATCVSITPALMRLAGEIGMEITVYIDQRPGSWTEADT
jgi:hypothetical protein